MKNGMAKLRFNVVFFFVSIALIILNLLPGHDLLCIREGKTADVELEPKIKADPLAKNRFAGA